MEKLKHSNMNMNLEKAGSSNIGIEERDNTTESLTIQFDDGGVEDFGLDFVESEEEGNESDRDSDEDEASCEQQTCNMMTLEPFKAIDIGLGVEMNAIVQRELSEGICGATTDVGIIAEQSVEPSRKPETGMSFCTGLEMLAFCHSYAHQTGFQFSIRTSSFHDGLKKKERKASDYLKCKVIRIQCKRSGEFHSRSTNPNNIPKTQKTGCKVVIAGVSYSEGVKITTCNLDHNHELNPEGARLMVNYRVLGLAEQEKLLTNYYAGIPVSKNYRALSVWLGGAANLKFNENDARNFLKGERRKGKIKGDAKAMLSYFENQRLANSDFFFDYEKDDEGRLVNVFWADPRCRAAYRDFDEVVTFDTTHMSNDYSMPFAIFVGVNHHGSSFIFAFALMSHEDSKSFCWVFNAWLRCMGKQPAALLSDQCRGIRKAVRIVFPGILHRLCIWHLLQNAWKNLGARKDFDKLKNKMKTAVHDSLSLREFQEVWKDMVIEFDLQENPWIQQAYKIRRRWVPGYWRDTFWAGMSSTQRSEQMNRFVKGYLNSNTGLLEFIVECNRFLARKTEIEVQLNNDSFERPLFYASPLRVVKIFHTAYTNTKFEEFLDEVKGLAMTNAIPLEHIDDAVIYDVSEKVHTPIWRRRIRQYKVSVDKTKEEYSCNCKLFEFRGILCKHILKAMQVENIDIVPEKYVLKRWRKNIVRDYEKIKLSYYDPMTLLHLRKYRELSSVYERILSFVIGDDDAYKLAIEEARSSLLKFEVASTLVNSFVNLGTPEKPNNVDMNLFGKRKVVEQSLSNAEINGDNLENDIVILDPLKRKKGSGRPVTTRRKAAYELRNGKRKRRTGKSTPADKVSDQIVEAGDARPIKNVKVTSKKGRLRIGQNMRDLGSIYKEK